MWRSCSCVQLLVTLKSYVGLSREKPIWSGLTQVIVDEIYAGLADFRVLACQREPRSQDNIVLINTWLWSETTSDPAQMLSIARFTELPSPSSLWAWLLLRKLNRVYRGRSWAQSFFGKPSEWQNYRKINVFMQLALYSYHSSGRLHAVCGSPSRCFLPLDFHIVRTKFSEGRWELFYCIPYLFWDFFLF